MHHLAAVGPRSRASTPQNCGDKLVSVGACSGKDVEINEQGVDATTTNNQSNVANRSLVRLMERTGYSIVQQNGQRRYGPPPDWSDTQPPRGCEVFVGKIPRDCFEDELVPVFERFGQIYEMRLMMDYNGMNRGYAFVVYTQAAAAKECVRALNNWEIRKGRTLGICMSIDNCRLFVGGIPKKVNKEDIRCEMEKVTKGVVDIIVYPSASDKSKNRGFAFIEYESHRSAAMARRKLMQGRVQLWGHQIAVDWAEPELEVPEEVMAQVKVLYVRNLMLSSTEAGIEQAFSKFAPVERVKKIRDYAFVHFHTREGALSAMNNLNGSNLDGAIIEVTLAKPVDKETYPRSPRHGQQQFGMPPIGILPVDCSQIVPTLYSGYYQTPPKYIPRNSMGARVIRTPRTSKGRCRSVYPVTQIVIPASPVQGPYVPQYFDSPKRAQSSEEPFLDLIPGVELSPAASHQAASSAPMTTVANPFLKKSPITILEEICVKNYWGLPSYAVNSMTQMPDGYYYQYKVLIPVLRLTFLSAQFSRSVDEARSLAAEVALSQLGLSLEGGTNYAASQTTTPPLISEALASFASPSQTLVALSSAAKQGCTTAVPNWPDSHNIYTGFVPPTADLFRRTF